METGTVRASRIGNRTFIAPTQNILIARNGIREKGVVCRAWNANKMLLFNKNKELK
jgi:hypothetical protein